MRWMHVIAAALAALSLAIPPAAAENGVPPVQIVASFSILADFAAQIGAERVAVTSLVGPDGDVHVYQPTPADAKKLAKAQLILLNGGGLEGWIDRLAAAAANPSAKIVVAGAKALTPGDPHAWQDAAKARLYVAEVAAALIAIDPPGEAFYSARLEAYSAKLDALGRDIRAAIEAIPPRRRRAVTTHDSLGYFARAYGLTLLAPQGVSTETEIGAKGVAAIIRLIRAEGVPAVFLENAGDPRLMRQIARETGAKIGGRIYSDALSPPDGPASTYIDMMRHNLAQFSAALQ